jgi:hypothetical protein
VVADGVHGDEHRRRDVLAGASADHQPRHLAFAGDDDSPHLAKDLDIRVMTILPGGERTESEYARLLTEAGFRPQPAAGLGPIESVMVGVPAGNRVS